MRLEDIFRVFADYRNREVMDAIVSAVLPAMAYAVHCIDNTPLADRAGQSFLEDARYYVRSRVDGEHVSSEIGEVAGKLLDVLDETSSKPPTDFPV